MIIISIIATLVSFLLQGITSMFQNYQKETLSIFLTIYPLISLLVLVPYYDNNKKMIILTVITGLLIDFVYTNTLFFNAILFTGILFLFKLLHSYLPYNLLTVNISNLLSVILYHVTSFLLLVL